MINEIAGHGSEDEDKVTDDYTEPYELPILKRLLRRFLH